MKFKNEKGGLVVSLITVICGIVLILVGYYLWQFHRITQATFNVDALHNYLTAHRVITGKDIGSLSEVPDFHLISSRHSLSAQSAEIKKGMVGGYLYDYNYLGDGKLIISASPVGFFSTNVEIGITEEGDLKVNDVNVDAQADSREEVKNWRPVPRFDDIRTKELPEYVRD